MNPPLRALIDRSKFHQGAVREVAALLPADDEELDALVAEIIASGDQLGFMFVLSAALDAGRPLDAQHLVGGAGIAADPSRLGCFAWKMIGDVPGALLAAMTQRQLPRELHTGALFVAAAWCAERRGGEMPAGFAAQARPLARLKNLPPPVLVYLHAAALLSKDETILAVLRQQFPPHAWEASRAATEKFIQATLTVYAGPVLALVPTEEPHALATGRTMRRAVEKLSRNDPCPCGSGRKYKRCCFEKDLERLRFSTEVAGKTHVELRAAPETDLTESRLKALPPFELARLDPRKVPRDLIQPYLMQLCGCGHYERAAECYEALEWNDHHPKTWDFVMYFALRSQRKDLAQRLIAAARERQAPQQEHIRAGIELLLAREDPAQELRVIEDIALKILRDPDPDHLVTLADDLLLSRFPALGVAVAHGLVPRLPIKQAGHLLEMILPTRDKLELPPDDPCSDLLERRLAEQTPDEGHDATALRAARQRLEAKAAEVRALKDEIEDQRRRLDRQERVRRDTAVAPQPAASSLARAPAEEAALRDMRAKLSALKLTLDERAAERISLRRELERARGDLETLRQGANPAASPQADGAGKDEAEDLHYLPEHPAGNQPLRLVEYPPRFRETLDELPRQAARGALAMLGRLAGGEPAAFAGVVQLKACHGILRQRVGSEHRLLFRLLPDRVQAVDLINRRDLDRTIKRLRVVGG